MSTAPCLTATGLAISSGSGTLVEQRQRHLDLHPGGERRQRRELQLHRDRRQPDGVRRAAPRWTSRRSTMRRPPAPVTLAAIAEDSGARLITQAELLANASDVDGASPDRHRPGDQHRQRHAGQQRQRHLDLHPGANDDSAVSFSYTVSDGSLDALAGSATLDITPVNDAPTTTPVTLAAIAEDSGAARHHPGRAAGQCQRRRRRQPDREQPGHQRRAAARWSTTATAPGPTRRRSTTTPR